MINENEIVTVQCLIEYLEKNFKREDRLCFFHEGGAWCEVEHLLRSDFGGWFFNYMKDKRDHELAKDREEYKKYTLESYKNVHENDVVIY